MEEFIRIREWPIEHANRAYNSGHYIEALQTLHGWIEVKLREVLQLQRIKGNNAQSDWCRAWDTSNEISLSNIARVLFVIGALSQDQLERILRFNRIRNNLIHKLFHDPYDKKHEGIPKSEFDSAFQTGCELGVSFRDWLKTLLADAP